MRGTRSLRRGGGFLLGALLWALSSQGTLAQESASGRIPTVTRLVRIMLAQEEQLAGALRGGDRTTVETLLADDFEMRVGTAPGAPVARDDWVRNALARPGPARLIEQMSAHEIGEVVLASFLERGGSGGSGSAGAAQPDAIYVVDVWRRTGDTWKLARRFASPGLPADFSPTGGTSPTIPKRP